MGGKININTASVTQLKNLPRIGVVRAQAIVDYRTKNGLFKRCTDLKKVKGIGKKTYKKLEKLISIRGRNNISFSEDDVKDDDPTGRVNLNFAMPEDFKLLPNIGKSKANLIIQYRKTSGYFNVISDIKKVKGIGPKTFDKLKYFITVRINVNDICLEKLENFKGIHSEFIKVLSWFRKKRRKISQKRLKILLRKYPMPDIRHFFVAL